MMKWLFSICCTLALTASNYVIADESGWALFSKVQHSVRQHNFDVSFVVLKGGQAESYRWLHGRTPDAEIEHLIPMFAEGVDIIRRDNQVYYLLSERPSLITQSDRIKELPALFFEDISRIKPLYTATAGSSSVMDGRSAQLLRLSANNQERYHYWLWIDVETGFPLRIDTLAEQHPGNQNRPLEIWQVTHLRITPEITENLEKLLHVDLPQSIAREVPTLAAQPHQLNWLPTGFDIIPQVLQVPQLEPEILSYWLLSDGLHQISVFVQRSHRLPTQAYRDGAITIYVQSDPQLDITVIGPINVDTAQRLASAIR